ncbi:helix-turn-helix domain-containing protein [Actinocorallia sp. A-T 12471]|uniref:TetR/AcrR family transcriptional regulator n=1 Tax=Actinocorallia sp. A-T 12471 TaxID=3089813 RepID=UPI0029CED39F|nr:helix-turn-helix domain-containing protein [Actinocorallia sp. A-T 12471]MDX6740902.1 helix-turn-helix domain-containing protein [Actinocorallia sp. A-T 12471]
MGDDGFVEAATRLFSALGYDGVTVAMLAEAAGVAEADVARRGGKAGVYAEVMDRVRDLQVELVEEMGTTLTPDLVGLHDMVDMFLDFYVAHPEAITLWQHRGLADAVDIPDVERDYGSPVIQGIYRLLVRAGVGPRARFALHNFLGWSFHSFLTLGIFHSDGTTSDWRDPAARARFRQETHDLIDVLGTLDSPS